jgi:coenzyme F430 synthetase
MKLLVVDMTHGGTLIAKEFLKFPEFEIFAWDIYSTIDHSTKKELSREGIKFIENENSHLDSDFVIVAPVHCKLESNVEMTHHEAVGYLLKNQIDVPIIEVTGVKGKTSVVWMLKQIFKDLNPLVLSSLGLEVYEDGKWKVLKQNISITPASMLEAWDLAVGHEIGICIFETSLGGTGLADVGILTNLVEDYNIADQSNVASNAKAQIFKSKMVACELNAFNTKYTEFIKNTNTFHNGISVVKIENQANLTASNITFGFDKTHFKVDMVDVKTLGNNIINGSFELSTFAPAPIHVSNILAAVCASIILEVPFEKIQEGLANFRGLKGRTTIKDYHGIRVIEEINPGLNVAAVKEALLMAEYLDDVCVIFGGKYGITCEEIDEKAVSQVLDQLKDDIPLILVDELGKNVENILNRNSVYYNDLGEYMKYYTDIKCSNILIIYRSNYSDVRKR